MDFSLKRSTEEKAAARQQYQSVRDKYKGKSVEKLFNIGKPILHPSDLTFQLADEELLLQLACEQGLDSDNEVMEEQGLKGYCASWHAVAALMHLGKPTLIRCAPALAERALTTCRIVNAGSGYDGHMECILQGALMEAGQDAVEHCLAALRRYAEDVEYARWAACWSCVKTLGGALVNIALESKDPALAQQIGKKLLAVAEAITALMEFIPTDLPPESLGRFLRSEYANGLRNLCETVLPLLPFLRSAETLSTLRDIAETAKACHESVEWEDMLSIMGLEPCPDDPLVLRGDAKVIRMWIKRHGKERDAGPYPGQEGHVLPDTWVLPACCGYDMCAEPETMQAMEAMRKYDWTSLMGSKGGMAVRMGHMDMIRKVLKEGRRYKVPLDKLTMCSGCRTVYYCSTACQNSDWCGRIDFEEDAGEKITHSDFNAPYGGCVTIDRLNGRGKVDKGHKGVCKMYAKARAAGMSVGLE